MRVVAVSFGTEGDARPLVALGLALQARGHQLVLALPPSTAMLARSHGIEVVELDGDLRGQMGGEDGRISSFVRRGRPAVAGIGPVRRLLDEHLTGWTRTVHSAARGADTVLSSGLSLPVGFSVAEALDLPVVGVFFQPFAASRHLRSSVLPPGLPLALHGPLFTAGQQLAWRATRQSLDASREALGLARRRQLWKDYPQLCAWSPSLLPAPPDWGDEMHVTGAWVLDEPAVSPPPELAAFLADGPPPVHVGFGSMGVGPEAIRTILDALDGRRALLAPGWSGQVPATLPRNVRLVGHTPHDWLFGRVALSVHHAGAGTTHAAVRAGIPSVPVPVTADQPFWADLLHRQGCAPRPIPLARLTRARVTRALAQAPTHAPRAQQLGARLRGEQGAEEAVRVLEELVRR